MSSNGNVFDLGLDERRERPFFLPWVRSHDSAWMSTNIDNQYSRIEGFVTSKAFLYAT